MQFTNPVLDKSEASPGATVPIPDRFRPSTFALLSFLGFSAAAPLPAETAIDFERQELYAFEQCTSTCQIELDRQLLHCPEYVDDSENIEAEECRVNSREQYRRCLAMCPADPRPISRPISSDGGM